MKSMMKPPLEIQFTDVGEIRMGSPYNHARIAIAGRWNPGLNGTGFQDIAGWSSDYRYAGLVKWDVQAGNPGFYVYVLDCMKQSVTKSDRIEGCCKSLEFNPDQLIYHSFIGFDKPITGAISLRTSQDDKQRKIKFIQM